MFIIVKLAVLLLDNVYETMLMIVKPVVAVHDKEWDSSVVRALDS